MTMLLPLFILVGFIAGYFVNAMAYHLCHERCNSDPHPTPEIRSRG
ncbi:Putative leader peptidase [Escherichia coli]|nr:Putative leader peptidase [Escherichia coli]CTZ07517.1 Putative leader peptidase [Escherichia coli]CTZ93842.1 Putative leader peptidase [Escherichia coli]